MTTPDVTVVVPVYNVAKYIGRCADSLFAQTLGNIEYIFVDDHSPDNSMELINRALSAYPNRKGSARFFTHANNQGPVAARLTGITHAKGKYVICADGDDWLDTDMAAMLYDEAEKGGYDIVCCNYAECRKGKLYCSKTATYGSTRLAVEAILSGTAGAYLWNKLVRRDLYASIAFYSGCDMWEDLLTSVQLFCYASRVSCLDSKPLYYYNVDNNASVSSVRSRKKVRDMISNLGHIEAFLRKERISIAEPLQMRKQYCKLQMLNCAASAEEWRRTYPELNHTLHSCAKWHYKLLIWLANQHWDPLYNILQKLRGTCRRQRRHL